MQSGLVKKSKKSKGGKQRLPAYTPLDPSVDYNGPARLPRRLQSQQKLPATLELIQESTVASSGAGGLNTVFGNAPNGCADWSSVSVHWDEYRVLAITTQYQPVSRYSSGTIAKFPLVVVIDRDSSNNLTSYSNALAYGSAKWLSFEEPWQFVWKASSIDEMTWVNTAAPANNSWIKYWSGPGNTASTNMGCIFMIYLVEFRGQI